MCWCDDRPEPVELQHLLTRAAALADAPTADSADIPWCPHETAQLLAAVTRLHASAVHGAETDVGIDDARLTATDALIAASALLHAADLNAFDLSLWLSRAPQEPR